MGRAALARACEERELDGARTRHIPTLRVVVIKLLIRCAPTPPTHQHARLSWLAPQTTTPVVQPQAKKIVSFKKNLEVWSTESEKDASAKNIFDHRQIFLSSQSLTHFCVKFKQKQMMRSIKASKYSGFCGAVVCVFDSLSKRR